MKFEEFEKLKAGDIIYDVREKRHAELSKLSRERNQKLGYDIDGILAEMKSEYEINYMFKSGIYKETITRSFSKEITGDLSSTEIPVIDTDKRSGIDVFECDSIFLTYEDAEEYLNETTRQYEEYKSKEFEFTIINAGTD